MRKILCIILAGFILLSFTACGIGTDESKPVSDEISKIDGDETIISETEPEPSGTTRKPYVQAPENQTFESFKFVVDKIFASLGDGYDNLQYQSAESSLSNEQYGIRNKAHIWRGDSNIKTNNGPDRFLKVEIYVLEYNPDSENYSNLKVGDDLEFFDEECRLPAVVTGINGPYVISFYAAEGNNTLLADKVETQPEFTLGNLQSAYDAFMKIDPNKLADIKLDPVIEKENFSKFEILVDKVHAALGIEDYRNKEYQNKSTTVKNRYIGIRNMVHFWRGESDLDGNEVIWEFNVNVWIFEFDTESQEYKDLKEGSRLDYYENDYINSAVVTAINGKYVLCIEASDYKVRKKQEIKETKPVFTLGNAQNGYEAFINTKVA
ncbi:MAG: hypothetical protein K5881_01485 [Saccharofermentans sp.]|nr:hypothetical protein [Saccharofermentans sp.]